MTAENKKCFFFSILLSFRSNLEGQLATVTSVTRCLNATPSMIAPLSVVRGEIENGNLMRFSRPSLSDGYCSNAESRYVLKFAFVVGL